MRYYFDYEEEKWVKMSKYEEIKARCDAATPGPWRYVKTPEFHSKNCIENCSSDSVVDCWWDRNGEEGGLAIDAEDAEFIVHARTDVPLLLKALELACEYVSDYNLNSREPGPDCETQPAWFIEWAEKELSRGDKERQ